MRTTASYELFPDAPSERAMARARYLVREGRVADAEKAYRELLAEHPDLKPGWAECFELKMRGQGPLGIGRVVCRQKADLIKRGAFSVQHHVEARRFAVV